MTNRTSGELADALERARKETRGHGFEESYRILDKATFAAATALREMEEFGKNPWDTVEYWKAKYIEVRKECGDCKEMEGTRLKGWVDTIAFAKDPAIRFLRDDPKDTQTVRAILTILTDPREASE